MMLGMTGMRIMDQLQIEILTRTAGSVTAKWGSGGSGTARVAAGVYEELITCTTSTDFIIDATGFQGTLSNIYVQELDQTLFGNYVDGFITLNWTGSSGVGPGRLLDDGAKDFSLEVSDPDTSNTAVLPAIENWDGDSSPFEYDAIFIRTPSPASSFYFDIAVGNNTDSVATLQYMNSSNAWTDVDAFIDNTIEDAETLAVSGHMMWSHPTDEISTYMCGQSGFWYRIKFSVDLDAVTLNTVKYGSGFVDIQNVWNGAEPYAIEAMRYEVAETAYSSYSSENIQLADLGTAFGEAPITDDAVFFNSFDPIEGFYIDVGDTPNLISGQTLYAFYWDGSAWAALTEKDGTAGLTKSGWVTFDRPTDEQPRQFEDSKYYSYWYAFTMSAEITNLEHADDNDYDMIIGIKTMPYFDISQFGKSIASGAWKDRMCYSFSRTPSYIYVTAQNSPLILNGVDFGILQAGDGRRNRVLVIRKFVNELMAWQEETGEEGGCVTIFEGYHPSNYGRLVLTSKVGIVNNKSVAVVDGVITSTRTDERVVTAAYWISRYGVFFTDGRVVSAISDDIRNYFDPTETECIHRGYEDQHWLAFDSKDNVLRLGLVSGTSATTPNVFPVYDLTTGTWGFDTFDASAKKLSCMTEIEEMTATKSIPVWQVAGTISGGQILRLNNGVTDEGTYAVVPKARMEINAGGYEINLTEIMFRVKANVIDDWIANTAYALLAEVRAVATPSGIIYFECTTAGTSHATTEPTWDTTVGNTTADGTAEWTCRTHTMKFSSYQDGTVSTNADTKSMGQLSNRLAVKHRFTENVIGDNLDVEFKNDSKQPMYLLDLGLEMTIKRWQ